MFTSIMLSLGLALSNGVSDITTVSICESVDCTYDEYGEKYYELAMNNKGGVEGLKRRKPEIIECSRSSGKRLFKQNGRSEITFWEKDGIKTYYIMNNNDTYMSFKPF